MSKAERAEVYREFLAGEGYAPAADKDGDLVFKYEGGTYVLTLDDEDDEFVRVIYPNFWSIESEAERARVAEACLYATSNIKVAKVMPVRDTVWATIEMFCASPEAATAVLIRCLSALHTAVQAFGRKMKDESSGPDAHEPIR